MDFLDSWERCWSGIAPKANTALRDDLLRAYAEPARHYHTLQHLEEGLDHIDSHRSAFDRPDEAAIAFWFHDGVYDPRGTDNELKSAVWAKNALLMSGTSISVAGRVHRMVMATAHGLAIESASQDEILLVDIDLLILASTKERFREYEEQISREYAWVPKETYIPKRREVLQGFLSRSRIFQSEVFQSHESAARANLEWVLKWLAG